MDVCQKCSLMITYNFWFVFMDARYICNYQFSICFQYIWHTLTMYDQFSLIYIQGLQNQAFCELLPLSVFHHASNSRPMLLMLNVQWWWHIRFACYFPFQFFTMRRIGGQWRPLKREMKANEVKLPINEIGLEPDRAKQPTHRDGLIGSYRVGSRRWSVLDIRVVSWTCYFVVSFVE